MIPQALFGVLILGNALVAPGSQVRILLEGEPQADQAMLSPAGDRIIYRSGDPGEGALREVFRNGDARNLAADGGGLSYGEPRFSPDGLYLLLKVKDARSGRVRGLEVRRVSDGRRLVKLPGHHGVWGPEGKRLAVVHPGIGLMVVAFPDGKAVEHFVPVSSAGTTPLVRFSPDGNRLVVVDHPAQATARLQLVDLTTGKTERLASPAEGVVIRPFWSADSRRVGALIRAEHAGRNASTIAIWNAEKPAELPRNIYASSGLDPVHTPAFSPDGKEVVLIHRDRRTGKTDLFALPRGGGRPARLTALGEVRGSVRWVDPRRLVVEGANRIYMIDRRAPAGD